ncbi:MAG: ABC transporter ATP-binding protein [Theionarchaea archaeon]|nr:ABC transporter ATP-binding protein [Theionarchaea archaeon]
MILIEGEDVTKYFPIKGFMREIAKVHAVEHVDFVIKQGETFGLVGESGCGKTTLGRMILRLIEPTMGKISYNNINLYDLHDEDLKQFRKETAIVFQDPYSSLDPRMIIADVVGEPLSIHGIAYGEEKDDHVLKILERVGLKSEHMYRYPHEFSGGQRQRIAIARAMSLNPKFVVLDEPTSALDVSVQAKILNMLNRLQRELELTYLFISHNLDVVRYISDRVGVMYLGQIVEIGSRKDIFENALHPYTRGILLAAPKPDPDARREVALMGEVPSAVNPPSGCRFHPRCPRGKESCREEKPELLEMGKDHFVACFNTGD